MILHRILANMQIHSNIATIQPSIAKTTDGTLPCAIENVASIVIIIAKHFYIPLQQLYITGTVRSWVDKL